jgi:uncharacterized iron-regulated protein
LKAATWLCAAAVALLGGCAGQPQAFIPDSLQGSAAAQTEARLNAVLPAGALLIGEQHDADVHQQIEQQVVALLAERRLLAAVALEMADVGASTASLQPGASEAQARQALHWSDKSWPWSRYGPAVMTAVRAGVPVLGANLPRSQMPASMANQGLDLRLPGATLQAQQQAIRQGHCDLLPESQIVPMTRLQIAKDISLATTIQQAAFPGKVVLLLAGKGHVDRTLGVHRHLPGDFKVKAVELRAGADGDDIGPPAAFDAIWHTPALPDKDSCAELKAQWAAPAK